MPAVGWDIGGVNTKMARVDGGAVTAVVGRPFEIQRDPNALVPLLREMLAEAGIADAVPHAVTMTAELSQLFRTKREGVRFVLDSVEAAFPGASVHVYTVDGRFLTPADARERPAVGRGGQLGGHRTCRGRAPSRCAARGHRDDNNRPCPNRRRRSRCRRSHRSRAADVRRIALHGCVRTPAEAIASYVPLGNGLAGVSAEGFALAGDVHVWRGDLRPSDYSCPTPDGRPATRDFVGERLARVVCADREMLDETAITRVAEALARAQTRSIQSAMQRVLEPHPSIHVAVVTGLGAFLGVAAAHALDLEVVSLSNQLGEAGARCAPAVAVALLLERQRRVVPS